MVRVGSGDGEAAEEPAAAPSSSAAASEVEEATEGCGSSPSSSGEIVRATALLRPTKGVGGDQATPAAAGSKEKEDAEMASPRKEEAPPTAPPAEPPTPTTRWCRPTTIRRCHRRLADESRRFCRRFALQNRRRDSYLASAVCEPLPGGIRMTIGRAFASAFASVDKDFLTIARQNTYGGSTVLCCLLRGFT